MTPTPALDQLPRPVAAALLDPATPDTDVAHLAAAHPVPDTYTALLLRPGTHPALAAAAHGRTGAYELLHYAVTDADPGAWDAAFTLAADQPATWAVLLPALASAPQATTAQRVRLARLAATDRDQDTMTNAALFAALLEDVGVTDPDIADHALAAALADPHVPDRLRTATFTLYFGRPR